MTGYCIRHASRRLSAHSVRSVAQGRRVPVQFGDKASSSNNWDVKGLSRLTVMPSDCSR